jgi:hypothetical protein
MAPSSEREPPSNDAAAITDGIRHDWTVQHQTLVLSGNRQRLLEVADQIGAPVDRVIEISVHRAALALDGDLLATYLELVDESSVDDI